LTERVREIAILLGAEIDLQAAYEKHAESQRASTFESQLRSAFRRLAQFPRSCPVYQGKFRRLVFIHFPYALFFTIEGERVVIHACLDTRQDPASIRRRLGT
jgi:plasmid stabilization system protein ParE